MKLTNRLIVAGDESKVVKGVIQGGYVQEVTGRDGKVSLMHVISMSEIGAKKESAGVIVSPSVARTIANAAKVGDTLTVTFTGTKKLSGGKTIKEFDLDLDQADGTAPLLASFWTAPAPVQDDPAAE